MKERPILFSATMVRAILDGTKTQTRRVVKPTTRDGRQAMMGGEWRFVSSRDTVTGAYDYERGEWCWQHTEDTRRLLKERCPYGQPGDRLWVREAFGTVQGAGVRVVYRADGEPHDRFSGAPIDGMKWTPSIHMPRSLSRITLRVTSVRVERLQDISEADAKAEGVPPATPYHRGVERCDHVGGFHALWESINGAGSWDANPWVWVVGFERVQPQRAEVGHG